MRGGAWAIAGLGARVGWLETTGTYPGDSHAMVFIGHISLRSPAGPGPFYNLRDLQPGSEIYYQTGGARYAYRVETVRAVMPAEVESLYAADGQQLILVTCASWNELSQRYERRLVVSARMVKEETQ